MSVSDGVNLLVLYVMNLLCFMSDGLVSSMLARLGNYYVSWIMLSSLPKICLVAILLLYLALYCENYCCTFATCDGMGSRVCCDLHNRVETPKTLAFVCGLETPSTAGISGVSGNVS